MLWQSFTIIFEKIVFRFTSCTLILYFFKVYYVVLTLSWVLSDLNITNKTIAWFFFLRASQTFCSFLTFLQCVFWCAFLIPHCVNNLSQMKNSSYLQNLHSFQKMSLDVSCFCNCPVTSHALCELTLLWKRMCKHKCLVIF